MKKGFTLVELLAVIVVLALISLVTMPTIASVLTSGHDKALEVQIDIIIDAAKKWSIANVSKIEEDKDNYISLEELIDNGYIEQDELVNPKTNEVLNGCVKIKFDDLYNRYDYDYVKTCP